MDLWQRNLRMIHQIGEILDFDSQANTIADFISLIEAMREGLSQIDDDFIIPDAQINNLFLTKLKQRPEWKLWATEKLQDSRLTAIDPTERMSFRELVELAQQQEKIIRGQPAQNPTTTTTTTTTTSSAPKTEASKTRPRASTTNALTQNEINAFVVHQMNHDGNYLRRTKSAKAPAPVKGHAKRPSQEEINAYVLQQMRQDEHKTRSRSNSQPEPRTRSQRPPPAAVTGRCRFCGDPHHQVSHCWRRWRVAVEAPQASFAPKRVDYKMQTPGQVPTYRSGFTLF
ncbi:hypothetical protein P168DRAFT_290202 [Aspergillus campestris IBT 28561]|uniref:Uncharacterized protein n=1 Tax=Aspergillus campestris (strain IBT 28561) TaxID=1392248 RepID=A0A2I1D2H1_ASPC2|nr:uncharacterized protein P168DRAFT_290202 [Aspergillus campestris IBT 28561]PKY04076.1 hypothetical protein P168DRAFT_290202 [Aspergillus campestris IBT 28561]